MSTVLVVSACRCKLVSWCQEDQKNLKSKMREKVRPKLGKIDIDYQKLHDAFFRFQTRPKMTIHGDLYYEVCVTVFVILLSMAICIMRYV